MIKSMKKVNAAGFSLVELMVVVAIIGILASVAIPNFNRFQRRARAAEGKTVLSGIYNAEKSFLGEWEGYSDSLMAVGYSADGNLRTDAGFGTGNAGVFPSLFQAQAVDAYANTNGTATQAVSQLCGTAFATCTAHSSLGGTWPTIAGAAVPVNDATNPSLSTFTVGASTNVGSGTDEQWTMDAAKTLVQVQDGINL